MDEKLLKIQQRLRAQLSQATAFDARCESAPLVAFEEVAGSPDGAHDIVHRTVAELTARGLRVAVVRRWSETGTPDHLRACAAPYLAAGAGAALEVLPGKAVLVRPCDREPTLGELLDELCSACDWDVVVCEGFGLLPMPKILVSRKVQEAFNLGLSNVIGYVSDIDAGAFIPRFAVDDVAGIADLIERRILEREPAAPPERATEPESLAAARPDES